MNKEKVLIHFRHGMGDAMQLVIVIRHLQQAYPDWEIGVEAWPGIHSVFNGICNAHAMQMPFDYRDQYNKTIKLAWPRPEYIYPGPSTKPALCLQEVFNLGPIPELWKYEIHPSEEATKKAERYQVEYLDSQPFGLIHYKGTSSPQDKDLTDYEALQLVKAIKKLGLVPVLLEWNPNNKLVKLDPGIANPSRLHPWLWDGQREGDGGTITALIQRANLFFGIDSGPEHLAAATDTPTYIFWWNNEPALCFDPAENVTHFVPNDCQSIQETWFKANYNVCPYGDDLTELCEWIEKNIDNP